MSNKYISPNGAIYSPIRDDNGNILIEAEQVYLNQESSKQIDSLTPIKTTEELTKENEHLWETIEFILKNTGFIPSEVI